MPQRLRRGWQNLGDWLGSGGRRKATSSPKTTRLRYGFGMQNLRWLDKRDADLWVALWAFITWVPEHLDEHLKRTQGMALTDFLTMLAIAQGDSSATMTELATATRMSPSRLSHVMDRLDKRGYTARTRSLADRRSSVATLTDQGTDFLVGATPALSARLRESIFEALTPQEAEQLAAILRKLLLRAQEDVAGAAR